MDRQYLQLLVLAVSMSLVVLLSNILVQFPINRWLTYGAFVYPVGYFITEVTNRWAGPELARRVVWIGFVTAAVLSTILATPRIAIASSTAFAISQLLDVVVFNRLRQRDWWQAPLVASVAASTIDTFIFFSVAFQGTRVPWLALALGDFGVKVGMAIFLLLHFRFLMPLTGDGMRRGSATVSGA